MKNNQYVSCLSADYKAIPRDYLSVHKTLEVTHLFRGEIVVVLLSRNL